MAKNYFEEFRNRHPNYKIRGTEQEYIDELNAQLDKMAKNPQKQQPNDSGFLEGFASGLTGVYSGLTGITQAATGDYSGQQRRNVGAFDILGLGDPAEFTTAKQEMSDAQKGFAKIEQQLAPTHNWTADEIADNPWEYITDPNGLRYNLGNMTGFAVGTMPLGGFGGLAANGLVRLGTKAGGGALVDTLLGKGLNTASKALNTKTGLGAMTGAGSGIGEAVVEGGLTYRDLIEQGMSPNEAAVKAGEVTMKNIPTSTLAGATMGGTWGRAAERLSSPTTGSRLLNAGKAFALGAPMAAVPDAIQEAVQEGISGQAKGEKVFDIYSPETWNNPLTEEQKTAALQAFIGASLMGGIPSAGSGLVSRPNKKKNNEPVEVAEEPSIPNGEGTTWTVKNGADFTNVDPRARNVADIIADLYHNETGDTLIITEGKSDSGIHVPGGHDSGMKFDFAVNDDSKLTPEVMKKIEDKLDELGVTWINEYTNPSTNSTGGHFDVSVRDVDASKWGIAEDADTQSDVSTNDYYVDDDDVAKGTLEFAREMLDRGEDYAFLSSAINRNDTQSIIDKYGKEEIQKWADTNAMTDEKTTKKFEKSKEANIKKLLEKGDITINTRNKDLLPFYRGSEIFKGGKIEKVQNGWKYTAPKDFLERDVVKDVAKRENITAMPNQQAQQAQAEQDPNAKLYQWIREAKERDDQKILDQYQKEYDEAEAKYNQEFKELEEAEERKNAQALHDKRVLANGRQDVSRRLGAVLEQKQQEEEAERQSLRQDIVSLLNKRLGNEKNTLANEIAEGREKARKKRNYKEFKRIRQQMEETERQSEERQKAMQDLVNVLQNKADRDATLADEIAYRRERREIAREVLDLYKADKSNYRKNMTEEEACLDEAIVYYFPDQDQRKVVDAMIQKVQEEREEYIWDIVMPYAGKLNERAAQGVEIIVPDESDGRGYRVSKNEEWYKDLLEKYDATSKNKIKKKDWEYELLSLAYEKYMGNPIDEEGKIALQQMTEELPPTELAVMEETLNGLKRYKDTLEKLGVRKEDNGVDELREVVVRDETRDVLKIAQAVEGETQYARDSFDEWAERFVDQLLKERRSDTARRGAMTRAVKRAKQNAETETQSNQNNGTKNQNADTESEQIAKPKTENSEEAVETQENSASKEENSAGEKEKTEESVEGNTPNDIAEMILDETKIKSPESVSETVEKNTAKEQDEISDLNKNHSKEMKSVYEEAVKKRNYMLAKYTKMLQNRAERKEIDSVSIALQLGLHKLQREYTGKELHTAWVKECANVAKDLLTRDEIFKAGGRAIIGEKARREYKELEDMIYGYRYVQNKESQSNELQGKNKEDVDSAGADIPREASSAENQQRPDRSIEREDRSTPSKETEGEKSQTGKRLKPKNPDTDKLHYTFSVDKDGKTMAELRDTVPSHGVVRKDGLIQIEPNKDKYEVYYKGNLQKADYDKLLGMGFSIEKVASGEKGFNEDLASQGTLVDSGDKRLVDAFAKIREMRDAKVFTPPKLFKDTKKYGSLGKDFWAKDRQTPQTFVKFYEAAVKKGIALPEEFRQLAEDCLVNTRKFSAGLDVETMGVKVVPREKMSDTQKKLQEVIGDSFGTTVIFFENDNPNFNGFYRNGEIYVNVKSKKTDEWIVSHELTHHLFQHEPNVFKAILEEMEVQNPITNEQIEKYRKRIHNGDKLSREDIVEEMVADAMFNVVKQTNILKGIATKNPTMAERIIEVLNSIVQKLKDLVYTPLGLSARQGKALENAVFRLAGEVKDGNGNHLFSKKGGYLSSVRTNLALDDNIATDTVEDKDGNVAYVNNIMDNLFGKVRFSLGRGNGYHGFSKSNNAIYAEDEGKFPASVAAKKLGVKTGAVKHLMTPSEWHHTGKMYNKTDYYDVANLIAYQEGGRTALEENLDKTEIDEVENLYRQLKEYKEPAKDEKLYRADVEYLTWGGTRSHPTAEKHTYKNIPVREKGSFYTFTLPNGTTVRKKIDSNGTRVAKLPDVAEIREREQSYRDTLSKAGEQTRAFAKENADYEMSMSGTVYPQGKKPTRAYRDNPSEFFQKGDRVLREDGRTAVLQEWDGNDWVTVETSKGVTPSAIMYAESQIRLLDEGEDKTKYSLFKDSGENVPHSTRLRKIIEKGTGVKIAWGHTKDNVNVYYDDKQGVIRSRDANNFRVVMPKVAEVYCSLLDVGIQKADGKRILDPAMRNYVTDYLMTGAGNRANTKEAKAFVSAMKKNIEITENIVELRAEFERYNQMSDSEKAMEAIRYDTRKPITAKRFQKGMTKLVAKFVDEKMPMYDLSVRLSKKMAETGQRLKESIDPYIQARLAAGANLRASRLLMLSKKRLSNKASENTAYIKQEIEATRKMLRMEYSSVPSILIDKFKPFELILREAGAEKGSDAYKKLTTYLVAKRMLGIHNRREQEWNEKIAELQEENPTWSMDKIEKQAKKELREERHEKSELLQDLDGTSIKDDSTESWDFAFPPEYNTKEKCQKIIKELDTKEFAKAAQDIYNFQDLMLEIRRDAGLLSARQIDGFKQRNENYIPLHREIDEDEFTIGDSSKAQKGSSRTILAPLEVVGLDCGLAFTKAANNKSIMSVASAAKMLGDAHSVEVVDNNKPQSKNVVCYYMNGKRYYLECEESLAASLASLNKPADTAWFLKKLAMVSHFSRDMLTAKNPQYGPVAFFRDAGDFFLYEVNNPIDFVKYVAKAFKHVILRDELFSEYSASGASQSVLSAMDREYFHTDLANLNESQISKLKNFTDRLLKPLEASTEVFEQAVRVAAYEHRKDKAKAEELKTLEAQLRKEGKSDAEIQQALSTWGLQDATAEAVLEGAYHARDLLDFAAKGEYGARLNTWCWFANAVIQGGYKSFRALDYRDPRNKARVKAVLYKMLGYTALQMIATALGEDDDDIQGLSDADRYMYYHVPVGKDFILRVPKPDNAFTRALCYWWDIGNSKRSVPFGRTTMPVENMFPSVVPSMALPVIETMANYSFFYNSDIVPARLQNSAMPEKEYDHTTSEAAKILGKSFGWSPKKIDYIGGKYLGFLGKAGGSIVDKAVAGKDMFPMDKSNPIIRRFAVQDGRASVFVGDAYEKITEQNELYKDWEERKKNDRSAKPDKGFDRGSYEKLKKQDKKLKELTKKIRENRNNTSISREEQKRKHLALTAERNKLAEEIVLGGK